MSWATISAGTFWMGSPGRPTDDPAEGTETGPLTCPEGYLGICEQEVGREEDEVLHLVRLSRAIRMQATEVTQEQFSALAGFNPSIRSAGRSDHPVNGVSWFDALVFANLLSHKESLAPCYELTDVVCAQGSSASAGGEACFHSAQSVRAATVRLHSVHSPYACEGYRLPTEAEWEYAARGPDGWTPPFDGDTRRGSDLDRVAWYDVDRVGMPTLDGPHAIAQKAARLFGLYDMQGNVWEWVWDVYAGFGNDDVSAERVDPTGPDGVESTSERGMRGGSWASWGEYCRVANRGSANPDGLRDGTDDGCRGFRLVRTIAEP